MINTENKRVCPNCGFELDKNMDYCPHCGAAMMLVDLSGLPILGGLL